MMFGRKKRPDNHHVLFQRRPWESQPSSLALRSDPQLITFIPREIHEALHHEVASVPILPDQLAQRALKQFRTFHNTTDVRDAIENLQRSLDRAVERSKRQDRLEQEIAQLAVYALDLQKPFVDDGYDGTIIDLGRLRTINPLTDSF